MKITNRANLPAPFVRMAEDEYKPTPKRYSITTLLKPVKEILLKRRHNEEIEQDCSEMIWLLFGKAVHSVLENYGTGENEFTEERIEAELENGYTVSGVLDFYDIDKGEVVDYKTASVWKTIYKDYDDWKTQGLGYAWLLHQKGLPCNKVTFYAILKDWQTSKAKHDSTYPQLPIARVSFNVSKKEISEIDKFIRDKIDLLAKYEGAPDSELPLCTADERWNSGDKYAVMKKGRKTAMRVLDSLNEAEEWKIANGGDYIETRKGEDKKCNDYCLCCEYCDYWKNSKEANNG